jgi:hypothetical protein
MADRVKAYSLIPGDSARGSQERDDSSNKPTNPTKRSQGSSPLQKLKSGADNVAKVDAYGFAPWGGFNLGLGLITVLSTFNITSPGELATAINSGVLPLALVDVLATLLGNVAAVGNYRQNAAALKEAEKHRREDGMGTFNYAVASGKTREAGGDAWRAIFPCARDVVGGTAGGAARIYALGTGASLWGSNAGVAPDCTFGALSSVTYVAAGFAQSKKVDNAVDRVFGVIEAAYRAENGPQTVEPHHIVWMMCLDAEFQAGKLSANAYETLRSRPPRDVERFLTHWWRLSPQKQQRLTKLLHFSGAQKGITAFNMTRTTNLNTASVRRAARGAVIDAFVADEVPEHAWKTDDGEKLCPNAAKFFDKLKVARAEALGAQIAPGVAKLKDALAKAERTNPEERGTCITPDELDTNLLRAIERSGCSGKFIDEYKKLDKTQRDDLRKIFHFGSWRFWRNDASLPTTKYQRADIRVKLVQRFAEGTPLDRLQELKVRYNQKAVPLRTVRTHSGQAVDNTMIHFVLAAQDTKLNALKEEKQNAKVKIAYGLANGAAAIAEGVVNPGAALGVSATRAILSAPYLIYAARRGLSDLISKRNAAPITAAVREDALLCLLPDVTQQIHSDIGAKKYIRGISGPHAFLRDEVGLTDRQIEKAMELERNGKMDALRAYLVRKNPHANILIALRRMAENPADGQTAARFQQLKAAKLHVAENEPSVLIERRVKQRLGDGATGAQIAQAVVDEKRKLAGDNPVLATRLFVDDLLSHRENVAAGARSILREFRFGEMEIHGLSQLGYSGERAKVASLLQEHLLGEGVRRRFSIHKLSKKARTRAADVASHVQLPGSPSTEPLTWRLKFEKQGVDVIDNVGKPGLDSMLHALQQHFEGKTDCSSSKMRKRMVRAREMVLKECRGIENFDAHIADYFPTIVRVASEAFGKPGAAVLIRETFPRNRDAVHEFGAMSAVPAAVLCYDNQTNRTFVLDGVDEPQESKGQQERQEPPRPEVPVRREVRPAPQAQTRMSPRLPTPPMGYAPQEPPRPPARPAVPPGGLPRPQVGRVPQDPARQAGRVFQDPAARPARNAPNVPTRAAVRDLPMPQMRPQVAWGAQGPQIPLRPADLPKRRT